MENGMNRDFRINPETGKKQVKSSWGIRIVEKHEGAFIPDWIDYISPSELGFESDDIDLEKLYCHKWYYANIALLHDYHHDIMGKIKEMLGAEKIELVRAPYSDIKVYFYADRLSKSGGKIKIKHAMNSLRWIYGESPIGGCTSIHLNIFKKDLDRRALHQLSGDELEEYENSGRMARDIELDAKLGRPGYSLAL